MNKERILELADVIERAPDEAFDMSEYSKLGEPVSCGSPGCIAGWAVTHFEPNYDWASWRTNPALNAQKLLDLTDEEEGALFLKTWATNCSLFNVPKSVAVSVLRHFAETGVIDWDRFEPAPQASKSSEELVEA